MARKKISNAPRNDFEYDEGEVCGFTSEVTIAGDCISSFSFDDSDADKIQADPKFESNNKTAIQEDPNTNTKSTITFGNSDNTKDNTTDSAEAKNTLSSAKDIFDNRRTPLPNGAAPAIDGETSTIKRSYPLEILP